MHKIRGSSGKRHQQEKRTRELYAVKKDVLKLGCQAACGARGNLVIGFLAGTVHSSEYRQRMTGGFGLCTNLHGEMVSKPVRKDGAADTAAPCDPDTTDRANDHRAKTTAEGVADAEESKHGARGSEFIIVISGAKGHQRTC